MSLQPYDPRLLEMMYQLTKHQKFMTPKEIASTITVQGKKVSERTVKRWFKWLKKNYYFTYHPGVRFNHLDLVSVWVFLHQVTNANLLDIIPYKVYVMHGLDFHKSKSCFFVRYFVPKKHLSDFRKFWKSARQKKLLDKYELFLSKQSSYIYSPFDSIVARDGNLVFPNTVNNSYFLNLFNEFQKFEVKLHPSIAQNPLIVPIVIEHFKDHTSSKAIWKRLKNKCGEKAWDYIRPRKFSNKKRDGVAINFIQKTLKEFNENSDVFFNQMNVAYGPFYARENNLNFVLTLRLKNKQRLLKFLEDLSEKTLYTLVSPHYKDTQKILVDFITNNGKIYDIIENILHKYAAKFNLVSINYSKSAPYWEGSAWLKLKYHELFDPKETAWRFETKEYLSQLKLLSPTKR